MTMYWLMFGLFALAAFIFNEPSPVPAGHGEYGRAPPATSFAPIVAALFLIVVIGMGFARQATALGFLMAGLAAFIRTGSLARFIILAVAGSLFHRTVLVFVPIIVIATGRSRVVSLFLGALAVALIYLTVLS